MKTIAFFLFLSFLIVISSLYFPKTFYSTNDLANVNCGLPFSFIQGQSKYTPPLPWKSTCIGVLGSIWETNSKFIGLTFLLDLVFVLGVTIALVYLLKVRNINRVSKK